MEGRERLWQRMAYGSVESLGARIVRAGIDGALLQHRLQDAEIAGQHQNATGANRRAGHSRAATRPAIRMAVT